MDDQQPAQCVLVFAESSRSRARPLRERRTLHRLIKAFVASPERWSSPRPEQTLYETASGPAPSQRFLPATHDERYCTADSRSLSYHRDEWPARNDSQRRETLFRGPAPDRGRGCRSDHTTCGEYKAAAKGVGDVVSAALVICFATATVTVWTRHQGKGDGRRRDRPAGGVTISGREAQEKKTRTPSTVARRTTECELALGTRGHRDRTRRECKAAALSAIRNYSATAWELTSERRGLQTFPQTDPLEGRRSAKSRVTVFPPSPWWKRAGV